MLVAQLDERIARRPDTVFVLLSGGATSLVAAPVPGVAERDLSWMFDALLTSGADITIMNADPQTVHAMGRRTPRARARSGARALSHRVRRRRG